MSNLRIIGLVLLGCAFALSFLVSISLPSLPALDIARTHYGTVAPLGGVGINEVRFGIWAYCAYETNGHRVCSPVGHGYTVEVESPLNQQIVTIGASWTRGLAVHPIATAIAFAAFLLAISKHATLTLLASFVSFFAAFMTFIAFAIDIALYAYVNHQMATLDGVDPKTFTGPGFWLTFVSLVFLLLAGCTVCFGHRRDHMSDATGSSYPMRTGFFSKFMRK